MTRITSYCQTCTVKNCIMLKSFGPDQLNVYKPYKHHYEFKKGELLFREGDEINGLYFRTIVFANLGLVEIRRQ